MWVVSLSIYSAQLQLQGITTHLSVINNPVYRLFPWMSPSFSIISIAQHEPVMRERMGYPRQFI